jgi:hypothetical protein
LPRKEEKTEETAEAFATDEHGKTRKEEKAEAEAFATELHGITRK